MTIDIGNNYSLSVKNDIENGVSIVLEKNGEFVQDLVVVERKTDEGLEDAVQVSVWGNEQDEDFTQRTTIPFFKPEDEEDEFLVDGD